MSTRLAFLEEIRAEPLTNYCAWNEPCIPVRRVPARGRVWWWRSAGAMLAGGLVAVVALNFVAGW